MTDFCSIDGRLTPLGEGLPGGVYLYQRLRTVDYRPLHTGGASVAAARRCGVSVRPSRGVAGRPHRRRNRRAAACQRLSGGRRDRHAAALCRRDVRLDGRRRVALSHLCPAKPASCGGGRSLRRLTVLNGPRRHAAKRHGGRSRRPSGPVARCALLCDRHGIVRRAGDAPLFAVRDDVIYAAPLDDVEWTLVAEAARRAGIGGWNDPSAQRSFGCSTNSSPSTARGSARSPPAKARPICRSRPNASPRHWRRFPNGRERFRAAAGRLAGRTGRPAFPENIETRRPHAALSCAENRSYS